MMNARLVPRALSVLSRRCKHSLPPLPFEYSALEPVVNREIMEIHYSKHHQTYVNNLNAVEESLGAAVAQGDTSAIIGLQPGLKFNGGGHINHTIFWCNLSPNGGGVPSGPLLSAIEQEFGSFDAFKAKMSAATVGIQGSGWGWLGLNRETQRLQIATCANQDPLQATTGLVPLLGVDVWEHAYYLQYKNVRPEYVKAIWDVVNWEDVAVRYGHAMS